MCGTRKHNTKYAYDLWHRTVFALTYDFTDGHLRNNQGEEAMTKTKMANGQKSYYSLLYGLTKAKKYTR